MPPDCRPDKRDSALACQQYAATHERGAMNAFDRDEIEGNEHHQQDIQARYLRPVARAVKRRPTEAIDRRLQQRHSRNDHEPFVPGGLRSQHERGRKQQPENDDYVELRQRIEDVFVERIPVVHESADGHCHDGYPDRGAEPLGHIANLAMQVDATSGRQNGLRDEQKEPADHECAMEMRNRGNRERAGHERKDVWPKAQGGHHHKRKSYCDEEVPSDLRMAPPTRVPSRQTGACGSHLAGCDHSFVSTGPSIICARTSGIGGPP